MKTDEDIQQEVANELRWDTHVDAAEIGVRVRNGVVTLTGIESSWGKKVAAEDAAHRVHGVLDVANDIDVVPEGASVHDDTELAAMVRQALIWDVFVPDEQIQSTVTDGAVTLRGYVATYAQRDDAARAVRNLNGVRDVDNQLAVAADQITPDAVRGAIHGALDRHAARETSRIQIDIEGGRVTLRGNIQSWHERERVIGAVTGTRGVEKVVDCMRIA